MMSDSDEKRNAMQSITLKDSYKTALDTRNFEISLFWQRSNYFLVLNSALALGFFTLQKWNALFLAASGLIVSWLWFRVNLGSKFWQSRWEYRLSEVEKKIDPELYFFAVDLDTIKRDVEKSIENDKHEGRFRRWIDKQVRKKHSVSHNMTLLSVFFIVGWAILVVLSALRLLLDRPLVG
jgi:uncharacterized membrane protein YciS (DUF1049 family)